MSVILLVDGLHYLYVGTAGREQVKHRAAHLPNSRLAGAQTPSRLQASDPGFAIGDQGSW